MEGQLSREPALAKVTERSVRVQGWLRPTVMREACFMGKPNSVGPPGMAPLAEEISSRAMMMMVMMVQCKAMGVGSRFSSAV